MRNTETGANEVEGFRHPTAVGKSSRKGFLEKTPHPSVTCQCLILGGAVAWGTLVIQYNVDRKTSCFVSLVWLAFKP